jgi:general secretion pathway protein N
VTPLLPGRFSWSISPLALLGMVEVQLANSESLAQPLTVKGSWSHWQLSPSALLLPATGLSGLGAPLNTMAPSGVMQLSWTTLELALEQRQLTCKGAPRWRCARWLRACRPCGRWAVTSWRWTGRASRRR